MMMDDASDDDSVLPMEPSAKFASSSHLTLIKQGAEARLYRAVYLGRPAIVKERFPKSYRHATLDSLLTKERLRSEVRFLARCKQLGVDTPTIYFVDSLNGRIVMECVESITVREHIQKCYHEKGKEFASGVLSPLVEEIGKIVATMHNNDIIHGDLTTSNMLLRTPANENHCQIVVIDFGLSYINKLAEDKAVDLYVLEKAFLSTHPNSEALIERVLDSYMRHSGKMGTAVLTKLDDVRLRGRKRLMVG